MLDLPPRGGFWKWSKWPWNMIHLMSRRHPCRLHIHLAFTYSVGPSSGVWSQLGPAPLFPPMRVLEVQWAWALSLMCEVSLSTKFLFTRKAPSLSLFYLECLSSFSLSSSLRPSSSRSLLTLGLPLLVPLAIAIAIATPHARPIAFAPGSSASTHRPGDATISSRTIWPWISFHRGEQ